MKSHRLTRHLMLHQEMAIFQWSQLIPLVRSHTTPYDTPLSPFGTDHDIYEFRRPDDMQYTNEGLLRSGFVGATPLYPTVAISIRTLEDHRQTHRMCPRLSIQATVRKLCHVHNICFSFLLVTVPSAKENVFSNRFIDTYVINSAKHLTYTWKYCTG